MERRVNGDEGCSGCVGGSNGIASSSSSSSFTAATPPTSQYSAAVGNSFHSPAAAGVGTGAGVSNCIIHTVSKFDTLAGVAIKYGVEVADVKRLNGLVTDLQMFALKTLQIPLPGRHPPSPILSNGLDPQGQCSSGKIQSRRRQSDFSDTFQSLKLTSSPQRRVSSAMSSLQGYYGLETTDEKSPSQDLEMAVLRKSRAHHRKSRSVANGFTNGDVDGHESSVEDGDDNSDNWIEKLLVRRRQKSEADFNSPAPEILVKEECSSGSSFSAVTGKGLALRPKSGNRTTSGAETETGWSNANPVGSGDSVSSDIVNGVRKSSSTSSLQESESNSLLSIWPAAKWSLKPDLNALSAAGITRPIFDGIPNPIAGRRNKAALD